MPPSQTEYDTKSIFKQGTAASGRINGFRISARSLARSVEVPAIVPSISVMNKSHEAEKRYLGLFSYLSGAPNTLKSEKRPFLTWVPDAKPRHTQQHQKCLRRRWHSPKIGAPQVPGDKPNSGEAG